MGSLVLGAFVLAIVVYAVMRGIWPGGDVWLVAASIVIVSSVHRVASEPRASLTFRVHAVAFGADDRPRHHAAAGATAAALTRRRLVCSYVHPRNA
jgi:hypothetical protein